MSFLALVGAISPAWGKERPPNAAQIRKAADAFDQGRDAYRRKGYVEAAEKFETADGYAPSAQALLLAIRSRLAAGQTARAVTLAELAANKYPDEADLQNEARALVEAQSSSLGKLNVTCDQPCELLLDGKLVHGRADTQRTVFVDPGLHKVRASFRDGSAKSLGVRIDAGGYEILEFVSPSPESKEAMDAWLSGKEGEPGGADAPEPPAAETQPDTTNPRRGWSPVVFWSAAGASVVGVGVSTVLGIRAINEPGADRVAEACRGVGTDCPEYQEGVRNQTAASVAIGITAGVTAFTVITGIWLTDWGQGTAKKDATQQGAWLRKVQPVLSAGDGFWLGAQGKF